MTPSAISSFYYGAFREPLPPGIAYISNEQDPMGGGGSAPNPAAPSRFIASSEEKAKGVTRDALTVTAKWTLAGGLFVALPSPWNWVAGGLTMGAMIAFDLFRHHTHSVEKGDWYETKYEPDPNWYEDQYPSLMNQIETLWQEMIRLRRDGTVPFYDRSRRYQEILGEIRSLTTRLEHMRFIDPSRILARGFVFGIFHFIRAALSSDEGDFRHNLSKRYGREALIRSYRRFADSLPRQLPVLPPNPSEESGYREPPPRTRVEVTPELARFEEEIDEVEAKRSKAKARAK